MQVDFHDNYLIAVVIFMLGIWFARNFVQLMQTCFEVLEKCCFCCDQNCLGYELQHLCQNFSRKGLALFFFMQPLFICLIHIMNRSRRGDLSSTIILCSAQLNQSRFSYKHDEVLNGTTILELDMSRSGCTEVDFLFIVMPFSAMVSVTTLAWVGLTKLGELHQDTVWDETIYTTGEGESVFYYDLMYCVEIWCLNFAFVFGSSSGQSFWELYYITHSLTVGMIFYVVSARHPHESVIEQWVLTLFLAYIISILVPFWNHAVETECQVSVGFSMTHAFCVFLIVSGHFIAMGRSTAGYILSLRIFTTLIACITCMIVMIIGRNQYC